MANCNHPVPSPSTIIDKLLMMCSVKLDPVELFPCAICDKLYCHKESLTNHLTTHVKEEESIDLHEEITGIDYAGTDCFGQKHMYSDKGKTVVTASGTLKRMISEDVTHPKTQAAYRSIRDRITFESEDTIDAALKATSVKIGGITCNSVNKDLIVNYKQTTSNSTEKDFTQASDAHKSQSYEEIPRQIYKVATYHICSICKRGFASNHELVEHLQTYIIDNRWKCKVCGKTFMIKDHLKNHHRIHTGERPYSCDICNIDFRHYSSFAYHKRKLHVSKDQHPTCDVCNIQCSEKLNLQKHILSKHMTSGYPCRICKMECGHPVTLIKHMLLHKHKGLAFKCKYCKKTFKQKHHKERHEKLTHKKSFDFECDMCRKKFGRKDHLRRHIVINSCQTPHKCRKCKRAYAKLTDLKKHKKRCKKK